MSFLPNKQTNKKMTSKAGDPRLGSLIVPGIAGEIVIIGFPHHEGTVRNGGRPGATEGPSAFRQFVGKMGSAINPEFNIDLTDISISDAGDVGREAKSLEEAHDELHKTVLSVLEKGGIPFVVGGSNDQSSSNGKALLDYLEKKNNDNEGGVKSEMCVVNIDAHLDVRPRVGPNGDQIHSGCPFRDLLLDPRFGRNPSSSSNDFCFMEFAAQGSQCSAEHAKFVTDNNGVILWLSQLNATSRSNGVSIADIFRTQFLEPLATVSGKNSNKVAFVSFDIDSISGADCPGVSCPSTIGLSADDALKICLEAGKCPNTRLFDLSEMNPLVENYRTPRLAVNMFYYFLLGYKMRKIRSKLI